MKLYWDNGMLLYSYTKENCLPTNEELDKIDANGWYVMVEWGPEE